MDKSSVLGDTLRCMRDLHERVRTLEERAAERNMESTPLNRAEDDESSDEKINGGDYELSLPDIEARVNDKSVLLKIQCEKRKGSLLKIVGELENLNMVVVSTTVAPFGNSALDITIVAEMEKRIRFQVRDVVTALRSALEGVE